MSPEYTSKRKSKYIQKAEAESKSKPWLKSNTNVPISIKIDEFEKK